MNGNNRKIAGRVECSYPPCRILSDMYMALRVSGGPFDWIYHSYACEKSHKRERVQMLRRHFASISRKKAKVI